ncbi:hypothetical protein UFOVP244_65 [uncultured Caudovirales phage]|uniref:Uncharacterized protein n=1 Tax=uncultured Caudovirales phage TaxID=2100421 RepID=A0A6J7WSQ0_9CAUD|nr:hypothetical protein UFOVP244_65 [uncultured Caudovirales phage]
MLSKRTVTATFLVLGLTFLGLGLFTSDHVTAQYAGLAGVVLMLTGVVRSLRSVTKPQSQEAAPAEAPTLDTEQATDSDISVLALVVSSIDSEETTVQDLNSTEANPLPVVSQKTAAKKTAKKPKASPKKTNTKAKKTPKKKKTGSKTPQGNKNKKARTKKSRR